MKIDIDLVPKDQRKEKPTDVLEVPFGTVFSDHMFSMRHDGTSWKDARIHPYSPLSLEPAALCLHYGQGIFEGLKAYRRGEKVLLFRPEMNFQRLNASAERMVMPFIDVDFALHSLKELLKIDSDWVPEVLGSSLYIRPTMIATEPKLGVRPSSEYLYYVILSPVGPYFKEGFAPVKIYVSDKYVRAVKGGTGAAKAVGNYAASLLAGTDATKVGYSQVLWLDALERKWIEEVGTMNLFVRFDDEVVTPPLSGSILPGITRASVLTLVKDYGLTPKERMVSIDEVIEGISSGKVKEIFGCGTAAIIAPVGSLWYKGIPYEVSNGQTGELTQKLFDDLIGIQSGEREDPHGWVVPVE
ncbi:MAG: branched-chain amino acid aminotransferase [Candidatus Thorarchaeota archaeon SMTZ1-45]|nr:MAG: branched chain amino acid aminotransferase [Candidatus Thorarchaeota archaeon SMTZ1-45]